jgi:hypothetical protein
MTILGLTTAGLFTLLVAGDQSITRTYTRDAFPVIEELRACMVSAAASSIPDRAARLAKGQGLVMLASFPNSGTTYTIRGFMRLFGTKAGTVYRKETPKGKTDEPGPPTISHQGFLRHDRFGTVYLYSDMSKMPVRNRSLLVKTHAGCYGHGQRVCDFDVWRTKLFCGDRDVRLKSTENDTHPACPGNENRTAAVVRLWRNPFGNVIARLKYGRVDVDFNTRVMEFAGSRTISWNICSGTMQRTCLQRFAH